MILEIDDVSFDYAGKPVLDSVRFRVRKGEVLGILGPNGSGKTTLLKILNRNLNPKSGSVFVEDVVYPRSRKEKSPSVWPWSLRAARLISHSPLPTLS